MIFNPINEIKLVVEFIENKNPKDLEDYFDEKVEALLASGITEDMHIGRTEWTVTQASEWLLSMFIGICKKGKEDQRIYNSFGSWLQHVYHFVINNNGNLPIE